MSFLKALFGPSQEDVWRQLSREVRGKFHKGGMLSSSAVQARANDWTITLDTYTQSTGSSHQVFTRIRAPFFNPEEFRFDIYRAGFFSELGKSFGMQDIEVGHRRFDDDFVIKGNAPGRVRRLFDNERVRRLVSAQPRIRLSIKAHEGWLSKYPKGIDELHFLASGTIKDLGHLRKLFDLFAEVLQEVCHEGRAYEDDVRIHIRRLRAPRARIEDKHLLWDNRDARRDAARSLGRLGDEAAVPALASVLGDADPALRALAVDALVRIGDAAAVRPLVAWLGDARKAGGRPFGDRVADALTHLGEADLVDAVLAAFGGRFQALKAYGGSHREGIVEALVGALGGPFRSARPAPTSESAAASASALGEINATEALPDLRKALRAVGPAGVVGVAVARAVKRLETRAALPRAASGAAVGRDQLPRPASRAEVGRDQLPKPASPSDDAPAAMARPGQQEGPESSDVGRP